MQDWRTLPFFGRGCLDIYKLFTGQRFINLEFRCAEFRVPSTVALVGPDQTISQTLYSSMGWMFLTCMEKLKINFIFTMPCFSNKTLFF